MVETGGLEIRYGLAVIGGSNPSPSATYCFIVNKVDSFIGTPTIYPFVISNCSEMTDSQVADEVLYTGLIEIQELDASGQDPVGVRGPTTL